MGDQGQNTLAASVEDYRENIELINNSEVDIREIKSRIQAAVERRQAEGRTSFIDASAKLLAILSHEFSDSLSGELSGGAEIPGFRLQPEFIPRSDNHYHVTDLLQYHDQDFIWNAYRALLKREPDSDGFDSYLEKLRSGRFNKIDVLARLHFSPEGRRADVKIDGLRWPAIIRRLYRLPVVGYLLELTVGIARLPFLIRNQREIEGYLIGQQTRLVEQQTRLAAQFRDSFAAIGQAHGELRESFAQSLRTLAQEQKAIARLQHQQVAALFRQQQKAARERNSAGVGPAAEASPGTRERRLVLDEVYASFEDQFRGEPEDIKQDLKVYLPLLKQSGISSDILDLGCGRGDWLELLRDEGLRARGVESNRSMIDRRRDRELEIIEDDAIAYLRGLPENSLRAVTAFHFVEHLGFEEMIDLLDEIYRVLKPGGLLIVETPNPKNLVIGACNFYSDPTHRRPLFPETLQFLFDQRGFLRTRLQYLHPVSGSPFKDASEASQALNSWLFSSRDFAIIGWKS